MHALYWRPFTTCIITTMQLLGTWSKFHYNMKWIGCHSNIQRHTQIQPILVLLQYTEWASSSLVWLFCELSGSVLVLYNVGLDDSRNLFQINAGQPDAQHRSHNSHKHSIDEVIRFSRHKVAEEINIQTTWNINDSLLQTASMANINFVWKIHYSEMTILAMQHRKFCGSL